MLGSTVSHGNRQDLTVLTIFYAENHKKLDYRTVKNLAKFYGVEDILDEVRGKAEFYDKMTDMKR